MNIVNEVVKKKKGEGKKILVSGGAGYIGSVAVKRLCDEGYSVVVFDNLSKGKRDLVDKRAEFVLCDLNDIKSLRSNFIKYCPFYAVLHFAAAKDAGESMHYLTPYTENINSLNNLLICMDENNVKKIIFSSSAAVYGVPVSDIMDESHLLNPVSYYGFSKLECERILSWYSRLKDFVVISLRYFNVSGDEICYVDPNAKNIFPIIGDVVSGRREVLEIYGDSYDTPDGTCIRDYVHVSDLVDAHILALNLEKSDVFNLGTEKGYSVKELVSAFSLELGKELPVRVVLPREGDPPLSICSNKKALEILKWSPKRGLKEMVKSTLESYERAK